MEEKDVQFFKEQLLKMREEILKEVQGMGKDYLLNQNDEWAEIGKYTQHLADIASDNYEREKDIGLASRETALLRRIDKVLLRIEAGTFGICQGCGKEIPRERLDAIPYVLLCMDCKKAGKKGE
ncbi:TraR/DksA C4-type zinc finger protein [bacterium]|nr:TraR/DksA C4-type zinc finger protein [bacterium]MBU1614896.1 TraR/DksA C4-type zinc finger protein [bacterium]